MHTACTASTTHTASAMYNLYNFVRATPFMYASQRQQRTAHTALYVLATRQPHTRQPRTVYTAPYLLRISHTLRFAQSADSAQALRLTHQLRSLKSSTQQPCPRSARCGSMTSCTQHATLRLASTRHQVTNQSGACTTTD